MLCPKCGAPARQETIDIGIGNVYCCYDCLWYQLVNDNGNTLDKATEDSKEEPTL